VPDTVDPTDYRKVMSRLPTGVTVVGTAHQGGGVCGLTANAVISVSLEPPTVLVSIHHSSATHDCLMASRVFSVNVLSVRQEDVARRFAEKRPDRFDGVAHTVGPDGTPLLEGAVARLRCAVDAVHGGGDHTLFLGHVVDMEEFEGDPLVFERRRYVGVAGEEPAP
jgi:flavin reductase (DIM6/NTAB) family NADH-FMN oxidoreductase RutF